MPGRCFLCGQIAELTREHVIPQCLGGALVADLYCGNCNGRCGHEIDVELARQFGRYATLLCITRERGVNQPFRVESETDGLVLKCDGESLRRAKPVVRVERGNLGEFVEAEVLAGSQQELHEISRGLAKKYGFDADLGIVEQVERPPPTAYHEFVIDNILIRRAVAKIAYGLACIRLAVNQVMGPEFDAIRAFILGVHPNPLASANYADTGFMFDNHRPLHKIHLRYERENRILVGYVALFGTFRYTTVLAEGLDSPIEWAGIDYTYNPVSRREVEGNDNYQAPLVGRERALRPRHNRHMVLEALNRGQHVITEHSTLVEAAHVEESNT